LARASSLGGSKIAIKILNCSSILKHSKGKASTHMEVLPTNVAAILLLNKFKLYAVPLKANHPEKEQTGNFPEMFFLPLILPENIKNCI